jgi:tetratricopeptide (TPR) repeat protein
MQLVEIIFPMFNFPQWTQQFIIIVILLGFPVVAIVAWIFDRTPDGIVKTPPAMESEEKKPVTQVGNIEVKVDTRPFYLQKRNIFLILGVLAGIIIGQLDLFESEGKLVNYTGDRIPVAIADFENNTNDASLDGLSGLLITSLEQSKYLSVLTKSRMFDLLKQIGKSDVEKVDEKLGVEICERADINALVLTSIRQFGDLYSVDLKILDVDKNEYLYTTNVQAEGKKNIPDLIDEISKQTRLSLAERAEEVENNQREIASLTTRNLEAYKYYDLGEKAFYKLDFSSAVDYYLKAVESDSTFALALYRLAYSYQWNFNNQKRDIYINKAVQNIESVPDKERLYIRAESIKDFESRIPIYKEIINKYPNEKQAYFEIGDMLYHNGKSMESIGYFEKSYELDPSFAFAIQHLSWAYVDHQYYDKNLKLAQKSLSIYPDNPDYINRELIAYRLGAYFDEYFSAVRGIQSSEVQLINADIAFGDGYFYQGDYDKAKEKYLSVKETANDKVNSIIKLIEVATTRANLNEYLKLSDELLSIYTKNNNQSNYTSHLIRRAYAMLLVFDDKKKSELVVEEIEKIYNNKYNNVSFADQGGVSKTFYINLLKDLKRWDKAYKYQKESFGNLEILDTINSGIKYQQSGNYTDAIKIFQPLLSRLDQYSQYVMRYNLGICYMKIGEFELAIDTFDKMKNNLSNGWGARKLYYPKFFLYSGLANLEVKNYRQAKSNIETFLKIWAPAPESLKEKQMASEALKKINKAVS